VSGIVDFTELDVWVAEDEYSFIQSSGPPSIFPSQVYSDSIKWRRYELLDPGYTGFQESLDVFGHRAAVLFNLSGHSPGSVGLFVNTSNGVRRFFVGDAVWNFKSIRELKKSSGSPQLWLMKINRQRQKSSASSTHCGWQTPIYILFRRMMPVCGSGACNKSTGRLFPS
jgi:glyoxylase-like metal-dependent hydrolase (beta-lactamase superfamily II)